MQLEDVLDAVQGERDCSKVSTPCNAHLILVLPQLASVSEFPIEDVVSMTMATLYCAFVAPRMAAVDVAVRVIVLADWMPTTASILMKYVGMVTVCFTLRALSPVGEAEHRIPWFATLVRHDNVVDIVAFGRFDLALAPPETELKFDTAVVTDADVAVERASVYAPANAAASVDA